MNEREPKDEKSIFNQKTEKIIIVCIYSNFYVAVRGEKRCVNTVEYSMEYSMLQHWSTGFYEVKSDEPTLYTGIFHGIFHRVNAP
jgi:hypothetical protein